MKQKIPALFEIHLLHKCQSFRAEWQLELKNHPNLTFFIIFLQLFFLKYCFSANVYCNKMNLANACRMINACRIFWIQLTHSFFKIMFSQHNLWHWDSCFLTAWFYWNVLMKVQIRTQSYTTQSVFARQGIFLKLKSIDVSINFKNIQIYAIF